MQNEAVLQKCSRVGLIAMAILAIGGIVFYKERVFFADSSYIAFGIINWKQMAIQEHRYGSFVTQMILYYGQKMHLPLKTILKGYAVSFNLFYLFVVFGLHRYRQYRLSILMALYYFFFVSISYFWANDEIHQAIAWMFVFYGVVLHLGNKKISPWLLIIPFTFFAVLAIYTHFLVIIPMVFLWLYLWIENKQWPFSYTVSALFTALLALLFCVKYFLTPAQSYDNTQLQRVSHFSTEVILNSFNTQVVHTFFERCLKNYWISSIAFFAGIISLFFDKKKLLIPLVLATLTGYVILIGMYYAKWDDTYSTFNFFHIETEWASIAIVAATPFVFSFLPKIKLRSAVIFMVCIYTVRLAYIYTAAPAFTWRTLFKKQVLAQMKKKHITKLAMISEPLYQSKLMLDWALGDETLLTSAMNGDKPLYTFFMINKDDQNSINNIKTHKDLFVMSAAEMHWASELNFLYFAFDTTTVYQFMTYDELFK